MFQQCYILLSIMFNLRGVATTYITLMSSKPPDFPKYLTAIKLLSLFLITLMFCMGQVPKPEMQNHSKGTCEERFWQYNTWMFLKHHGPFWEFSGVTRLRSQGGLNWSHLHGICIQIMKHILSAKLVCKQWHTDKYQGSCLWEN